MAYSTRQRRLGLLALGVLLATGDIVLLGLSSVRFFADRGSPLRRRYRDWFIEADGTDGEEVAAYTDSMPPLPD